MTQIKIISNPYKQEIKYETFVEHSSQWVDVGIHSPNGKLREEYARKCFLPFNVKEILDVIVDEYYLEGKDPVNIVFEGTREEFEILLNIAQQKTFEHKVLVSRSNRSLDEGKLILNDTKEIFVDIKPVIEEVTKDEDEISVNMAKVSDALDDIIPICVFGNYSAGKSTFINALIGREVLPSGGDPVTAKAFKIQNTSKPDSALIKFRHYDEIIEIEFSDCNFRILKGDSDDKMVAELNSLLSEKEFCSTDRMVAESLEFINAYEKRDITSTEIGNMIELFIQFASTGILGKSSNKYVIFDTPGSNTATNYGHIEVLREALEGFSNGIPVWVSQYEAIDTMDNEALCNDILSIEALDQRFTMIVLNKADVSDLPENGFSEKQIKNIKEFKSVEKMYASGIFFVSSIMGLGSKIDEPLSDKYYRKIYKLQADSFSDPEDEDYMSLYRYNIMPEQIKEEVLSYSLDEENIIYVNSGLHCIEKEIEEFASKYSAYNKCQMVYTLLTDVVDKTTDKIAKRVQSRKRLRDKYIADLDEKKAILIQSMREKSDSMGNMFKDGSHEAINVYAKDNVNCGYSLEELEEINKKYIDENNAQYRVEDKIREFEDAKDKMVNDFKTGLREFSFSNIKDSVSGIVDNAKKGMESVWDSKKTLDSEQRKASSETVDEVLNVVIETYKTRMAYAAEEVNNIACTYWENNSRKLKDELIDIVTASDALSDKQKETLSELIFNYRNITYVDKADNIFVKPKFLKWHLLGVDLLQFEKLNTSKVAKVFNKAVTKDMDTIATEMDETYRHSYDIWQEELNSIIERNIVDLNPELQVISDAIDNETERINHLETCQQKIRTSLNEIENLISFKSIQ